MLCLTNFYHMTTWHMKMNSMRLLLHDVQIKNIIWLADNSFKNMVYMNAEKLNKLITSTYGLHWNN